MQSNINESAQKRRRKEAFQSAVISCITLAASAMILLGLRLYYSIDGFVGILLLIFGVLEFGMIIPVLILLKARLNEIEGGEEDAAAKY